MFDKMTKEDLDEYREKVEKQFYDLHVEYGVDIEEEKRRIEEYHKANMKRIAEEEKHRVYNIWLEDDPVPYCIDDVPGFRDKRNKGP